MAIPRCRVFLAENDTMSRRTLRDMMYELPEDLFEFEIEGAHLMQPDPEWLDLGREVEPADEDDELDSGFGGFDARSAPAA
jgi:hypothetical protein